jgi:signal transduction histidine kinase/ActR/RegA family two-component response regulator
LKDALNEMIRTLGETTRENIEQDWLKTNRERFTRMLQGQRDLADVSSMILSELAPLVSAQHGVFYSMTSPTDGTEPVLELTAGYGYEERKHLSTSFRVGEGLVGQCAKEKKRILLTDVPGDYVRINSGLGSSPPLNIIVLPVLFEGAVRAVVELASFSPFSVSHQAFLEQLPESIGLTMNTIEANTLTENLLRQSQSQAEELRSQQEELRESNEDLERQASLLADRSNEAEQRSEEVQDAKLLVEEKAAELAVSSKYKSEFIANMSHELRTPLNSLLILAEQLADDPEDSMTDRQIEYAGVILASGRDLLGLLNSILDLAKVESGTATVEPADVSVALLHSDLVREFDHVARSKGLDFVIEVAAACPDTIVTDPQRLRQILKNLIANAFKFTERGGVHVQVAVPTDGWSPDTATLVDAPSVISFAVRDTGIGIEELQQRRIFEAFAQGDGTTARLYGGTGLGLSISRELVGLLGGEIDLTSSPGTGSTFTVYLPLASRTVRDESAQPDDPAVEKPHAQAERPERNHNALDDRPFEGRRILVIDDDFRNVFALTALLERGHAEVTVAESGAAALTILAGNPHVDLVLTDIMMPGMDGYDTMRAIRALDEFRTVPIIAVTGKVVPGERNRCLDAGANDYVPKPVDTADLIAALRPWLAASGPGASRPAHPSWTRGR